MSRFKQGTLEKVKTAAGLVWYLRYTDRTGAKTVRPRVRIGPVAAYPSKTAARKAAEPILKRLNGPVAGQKTFGDLLDVYERNVLKVGDDGKLLPVADLRYSTRRGYLSLIRPHIRPKWGKTALGDVKAGLAVNWLGGLKMGQRRKKHILDLMRVVFAYAVELDWLDPTEASAFRFVKIRGGTKRAKQPGTLRHEEFHALLEKLQEPYRTMVITSQCLGLRVSELMGLQWQDIDLVSATIHIRRAIVATHLGETKTDASAAPLPMHPYLAAALAEWQSKTEFKEDHNFIFASPWKSGELPYNASKIQSKKLRPLGKEIGLVFSLGWHTLRHTYRKLLRAAGAAMDVQRDLMRHADIHTTMQTYGGTELDELRPVNETVVEKLFGGKKWNRP